MGGTMGVHIFCTGDIHLGRRPSRIPEELDARALGPAKAWDAFVETAIKLRVDAAVLTGDIVDESNKLYEAYSALQAGVQRLLDAGIPVFAVAGNHDYDVLPRLAGQIPGFRLLGQGGLWEVEILERDGAPAVRFCGWSFPARYVSQNPLADFVLPDDGIPTVGLLHGDCDVPQSPYGPVSLAELRAKARAAWLLGHIHKPGRLGKGSPLVLYPGSLQALDPTEDGAHGAWLVKIEPGEPATAELLPLAGLRFEQIDLPLAGLSGDDSLGSAVIQALRNRHEQISDELGRAKAVSCRLRLSGRTALHRRLCGLWQQIREDLRPTFDGVDYFVEQVEDLTRPDLSLEDLARSNDPAGLLARRLLLLERCEPGEAYNRLVADGRVALERGRANPVFASLPDTGEPLTDEQVRDVLTQAGLSLLGQLVAQKEPAT